MIAQKYRLNFLQQGKLSPEVNRALGTQFANADEMFETLFTEARRVAALLAAGTGGSGGGDGSGGTETGYWSVLTDGEEIGTELIFAAGDVIMVFVPTTS